MYVDRSNIKRKFFSSAHIPV